MNDLKPGWRTSECWQTAAGLVLSAMVALGVISTADVATLGGALTTIIVSAFALVGAASLIKDYLETRLALKVAAEEEPNPARPPDDPESETYYPYVGG